MYVENWSVVMKMIKRECIIFKLMGVEGKGNIENLINLMEGWKGGKKKYRGKR